MIESIGKNLWLLLTILIPGFFTYGSWRIMILHYPNSKIKIENIDNIDDSSLTILSIILAIAIVQQIGGIFIEFILTIIACIFKNKCIGLHSLLVNRFRKASENKLNDSSKRIIGNCFLSMNVLMGLILLSLYYKFYVETAEIVVVRFFVIVIILDVFVIAFRIYCAIKAFGNIPEQKEDYVMV